MRTSGTLSLYWIENACPHKTALFVAFPNLFKYIALLLQCFQCLCIRQISWYL